MNRSSESGGGYKRIDEPGKPARGYSMKSAEFSAASHKVGALRGIAFLNAQSAQPKRPSLRASPRRSDAKLLQRPESVALTLRLTAPTAQGLLVWRAVRLWAIQFSLNSGR